MLELSNGEVGLSKVFIGWVNILTKIVGIGRLRGEGSPPPRPPSIRTLSIRVFE